MSMSFSQRTWVFFAVALVTAQALVLFVLGQPSICECGYIKVWEGVVLSSGNSQHLTDWYTFSHVIHGFLFYLVLWFFFPRMPVAARFFLAVGLEAGWEIIENTPMVIEHYRQQALAQGYIGDSVLNSVMDTLAMALGFLLAWRWPVWVIVGLAVVMEAFVAYSIRDNLLLNIIGLIYPLEFINNWQMGG
ncbi:DUF2585 family protein [Candidatus Parcubacteria bacterium]|nr:MAG: DUF2585 family protein [Candidatus Parcubacteria bacterium]